MIRLRNSFERLVVRVYSRLIRRSFRSCGSVYVHPTCRIDNPEFITLGDGVSVGKHSWIYAMVSDTRGNRYEPEIRIGAGTRIGDFGHFTCATRLEIGSDVLITRNVLVTDSVHEYADPQRPVIGQGLVSRPVRIGEGCWLGNNSVVISCSVGRHCVVGANSVVTRDVPDHCVVAGAPAKVIKRFNAEKANWERVREQVGDVKLQT